MTFDFVNTRGIKYYLHRKGNLYYFKKEKVDKNACMLPNKFEVVENIRNGLPMVKKRDNNED